jgi:hypothetical protein
MNKEYKSTSANPINTYSGPLNYGSCGKIQSIINPKPATVLPALFCKYKSHQSGKSISNLCNTCYSACNTPICKRNYPCCK